MRTTAHRSQTSKAERLSPSIMRRTIFRNTDNWRVKNRAVKHSKRPCNPPRHMKLPSRQAPLTATQKLCASSPLEGRLKDTRSEKRQKLQKLSLPWGCPVRMQAHGARVIPSAGLSTQTYCFHHGRVRCGPNESWRPLFRDAQSANPPAAVSNACPAMLDDVFRAWRSIYTANRTENLSFSCKTQLVRQVYPNEKPEPRLGKRGQP